MRMVGACNAGTEDYFRPTSLSQAKVVHPFQDHVFTFLKGTEVDVTQLFPTKPLPSSRARSEEVAFREGLRDKAYLKAPYLEHMQEIHLKQLALQSLCKADLTSGYDLGRLMDAGCGETQHERRVGVASKAGIMRPTASMWNSGGPET